MFDLVAFLLLIPLAFVAFRFWVGVVRWLLKHRRMLAQRVQRIRSVFAGKPSRPVYGDTQVPSKQPLPSAGRSPRSRRRTGRSRIRGTARSMAGGCSKPQRQRGRRGQGRILE